ncbi:MAG TPA: hypothetical protein P5511_03715 [Candidatus Goldiibacteriota bacterium]|nr:hypothetical protein [Candidatus Goldiibacteriota bacterium]
MNPTGKCPVCGREIELVEHHLVPKAVQEENWFKNNYTSAQFEQKIMVCVDCHNAIHKFHDPRQLGRELNSLEKILSDEKIAKFAKFAAKQKGSISGRAPKKRGWQL